jgi:hypothetical protein
MMPRASTLAITPGDTQWSAFKRRHGDLVELSRDRSGPGLDRVERHTLLGRRHGDEDDPGHYYYSGIIIIVLAPLVITE